MATALKFDELNRLDYKDYFGKMYISPEQMQKRIDLARDIEDVMLYLFAYWVIAIDAEISKAELKQDVKAKLKKAVEKHLKLDPYIRQHIDQIVDEVVDVTEKHEPLTETETGFDWEEDEESEEDEQAYWTSLRRAMLISANEANAFENYSEYREAKAQGKTRKRWVTMLDEKVRFTHAEAEGEDVDIDGLFSVGGYQMRFPMDAEYGAPPQETINCRCACQYE